MQALGENLNKRSCELLAMSTSQNSGDSLVIESSQSAAGETGHVSGDSAESNAVGKEDSTNLQADGDGAKPAQDPYFYTKRDEFTSEVHKIEVGNLPKIFGHGQVKKLLSKTLNLNPHKIKVMEKARFAFVSFRSEEERENALKKIEGYNFKGCTLTVKKANPMADPLIQKRKLGEAEDVTPQKRHCDEASIADRIKDSVAPWSDIPYEQQLTQKEEHMRKITVKYARKLESLNPGLKSWISKQRFVRWWTATATRMSSQVGKHLETGEITVGFRISSYRQGSMSVASPDGLPNVPESAKRVAKCFQDFVKQSGKEPFNPETHEGYWRQLTVRTTSKDHIMAIAVIHPQALSEEEISEEKGKLRQFFTEGPGKSSGVTCCHFQRFDKRRAEEEQPQYEHVFGTEEIEECLLGRTFQVSPDAFFQVNTPGAELLYKTVEEVASLNADTTLLDICCGTGTIGLSLASTTRSLRTLRGTASIKKLVYVSCNPEGAMQNFLDLARPPSNNYKGDPFVITKAVPVDMFPHTPHCELVLLMERFSA
ncbi:hypothetical protein HPB48_018731 [Haemaphysalis longicornis]|uniref:tRNA (uracil(54)-C(5))-methyltransferase n=1 Tax=Haemaphysalis longicornis TaxID=44386 RepID=A0A9J6GNP7_HAELO|nr:hypothetical protein HPB48_018731 [Haemaphysalis longicornis]